MQVAISSIWVSFENGAANLITARAQLLAGRDLIKVAKMKYDLVLHVLYV